MRWSIVRLIWLRELRDQLRDRRTLFMIVVLPIFLYPIAGYGLFQLVGAFLNKPSKIEVVGAENLPQSSSLPLATSLPARSLVYPPLFVEKDGKYHFEEPDEAKALDVEFSEKALPGDDPASPEFLQNIDHSALDNRKIDLILVVPPGFKENLEVKDDQKPAKEPALFIIVRGTDERSQLVSKRVKDALDHWKQKLTRVRLVRRNLPTNYATPFKLGDSEGKPADEKQAHDQAAKELVAVLVKVFPFILVMWSLAGALYPAIDLCAGEKERGTMETLLISPASREEIVWGKFLTIWVFSAATALLNLFSMGLTMTSLVKLNVFPPMALFWGVLLLLPLSAFFSAICLAVGAYARSSKEGQYYLMPLFLATMPLIFLTLAPDVTLNPFYSMVPITGVALLLQRLMAAETLTGRLMVYFIPVLGPMAIYSWLALRWAIEQFQREEVLFREAERLDLRLWFRSLFRDKEPFPTTGQALFCFALVLILSRLSISFGERLDLLVQQGVRYLAFVATPALFMAMFVTTRPRDVLCLRLPPWWAWPAALIIAILLFLPAIEYGHFILDQVAELRVSVEEYLRTQSGGLPAVANQEPSMLLRWQAFLVALLGAVCEELAFRGFILSGLRRRFSPWMAVFISSFLFALSQLNVFQFIPHFVVGVALGFLVIRSGSVLPAMLCHFAFNFFFVGPIIFPQQFEPLGYASENYPTGEPLLIGLAVCSLLAAAGVLYSIWQWTRFSFPAGELPDDVVRQEGDRFRPASPAPGAAVTGERGDLKQ